MTDIDRMDAGELRMWVAEQLADADEATFGANADAIAHGLDRLASTSGREMSEVLRDVADDVDMIRTAGDAPADPDETLPGTAIDITIRVRGENYTGRATCIDQDEIVHDTVIGMAGRLAYRIVLGLHDDTDAPARGIVRINGWTA